MTPNGAGERSLYNTRFVLTTGVVLALIAGFLDVSPSILAHSVVFSRFPELLPPLATTTLISFGGFLVIWFVVVAPIGRLFRLDLAALVVSLAVFVGSVFLFVGVFPLRLSLTNIARYMLLAGVAVLLAAGGYSLMSAAVRSRHRSRLASLALASPWFAALAMVFVWLEVERIRMPLSTASLGLAVAFIILVIICIGLLAGAGNPRFARRGTLVLLVVVFLSPIVTVVTAPRSPIPDATAVDHPIKHVILLVVDTLRRDALSCYGDAGTLTPNIDRLASDGIVFTDAVSAAPWTLPSMASIMSGLSPSAHLAITSHSALHDSVRTLAEYMRSAGYVTAAIGANPMLGPGLNLTQGFHEYDWFPKPSDDISIGKKILARVFPTTYKTTASTSDLTDLAIDWVGAHEKQDWFFWLHYFDPHHPYSPPKRYLPDYAPPGSMRNEFSERRFIQSGHLVPDADEREWIRQLYLSEVRYVDDEIGRLIAALERMGIYDDALIILTSDHGEEFWEHDGFEHGHTLYTELLSVPLIVKVPRQAVQSEVAALVTTESITPTVMDLCGVDFDEDFLGVRSLTPLWGDHPDEFAVQPVFSSALLYFEQRESVTFEDAKYIRWRITEREEVYDRVNDPNEQSPANAQLGEVAERARRLLDAQYLSAEDARDHFGILFDQNANLDKETLKQLRALGYM